MGNFDKDLEMVDAFQQSGTNQSVVQPVSTELAAAREAARRKLVALEVGEDDQKIIIDHVIENNEIKTKKNLDTRVLNLAKFAKYLENTETPFHQLISSGDREGAEKLMNEACKKKPQNKNPPTRDGLKAALNGIFTSVHGALQKDPLQDFNIPEEDKTLITSVFAKPEGEKDPHGTYVQLQKHAAMVSHILRDQEYPSLKHYVDHCINAIGASEQIDLKKLEELNEVLRRVDLYCDADSEIMKKEAKKQSSSRAQYKMAARRLFELEIGPERIVRHDTAREYKISEETKRFLADHMILSEGKNTGNYKACLTASYLFYEWLDKKRQENGQDAAIDTKYPDFHTLIDEYEEDNPLDKKRADVVAETNQLERDNLRGLPKALDLIDEMCDEFEMTDNRTVIRAIKTIFSHATDVQQMKTTRVSQASFELINDAVPGDLNGDRYSRNCLYVYDEWLRNNDKGNFSEWEDSHLLSGDSQDWIKKAINHVDDFKEDPTVSNSVKSTIEGVLLKAQARKRLADLKKSANMADEDLQELKVRSIEAKGNSRHLSSVEVDDKLGDPVYVNKNRSIVVYELDRRKDVPQQNAYVAVPAYVVEAASRNVGEHGWQKTVGQMTTNLNDRNGRFKVTEEMVNHDSSQVEQRGSKKKRIKTN